MMDRALPTHHITNTRDVGETAVSPTGYCEPYNADIENKKFICYEIDKLDISSPGYYV